MDVVRNPNGSLSSKNGDTYQFNQERGLVIIDSPTVGPVAVVPVGMTLISSIALEPEVGAELRNGDELGYFQFGGSDIVMLFPEDRVLAIAHARAPEFRALRGLVQKYYVRREGEGEVAGAYIEVGEVLFPLRD
jgi:phosphatidylserine decarboxylase